MVALALEKSPAPCIRRYMLRDEFGKSAVALKLNGRQSIDMILQVRTSATTIAFQCTGPYNATSGGDCTAIVPRNMFSDAVTESASLRLQATQQGTVLAQSEADIVLVGVPQQAAAKPRTGFGYGVYRFLYPGEVATFPFFANTNGEDAREFMLHIEFDNTVFKFVDEFEMGPGWQVR
jgi:hypothetical protein